MSGGYKTITFPKSRLATVDVGRYAANMHAMLGLVEVDVTQARRVLRRMRRDGSGVSFTAWFMKTVADCVAKNPEAHAVRLRGRRLLIFDDVDIAIPVEKTVDGAVAPLPVLIKGANVKTLQQIDRELTDAMRVPVSTENEYILSEHGFAGIVLRLYYALPQRVRVAIWRLYFGNAFRSRRHTGTVTVTTVNGVGRTPGWVLPTRSIHGLTFALGTISAKPWVHDGHVVPREILNLTVLFDHDVIDGAPARRFILDLVRRLEKNDALRPLPNGRDQSDETSGSSETADAPV